MLAVVIFIAGSRLFRLASSEAIYSETPVHIYLEERINLEKLSEVLLDSGVVRDKEELLWAANLLGWRNFNPGHYQVEGGYSYNVLLSRMAKGIQDPINLTILPGLDQGRLIRDISSQMKFDSLELSKAFDDTNFLAEEGVEDEDLIGRMYPNTYSVYWTSSPKSLLKRIFNEFETDIYEPYKARLEELDRSLDEIITLASIIEWEAKVENEKKIVSGLYWNRLDTGMRLQADPTVNFAVNERRRLLYEDYRLDHPYNTYMHAGLPPGPITNPSKSSIEAALFPEDHDYYYMVASPEGEHVFTETFEEHKQESAKWRRWLREQYRIKRERETNRTNEASR